MNASERDYQKLKSLDDFAELDAPHKLNIPTIEDGRCPFEKQMILRMLVRPKYGDWRIPNELRWLRPYIRIISDFDSWLTGIDDSWCYVTVRHGPVTTKTDDEWHFDGASFRTSLIPERNYIWMNHTPTQYKTGTITFPPDFNPFHYNLFSFATKALDSSPIQEIESGFWYLINPFCLHRRNPEISGGSRTFVRISFPDIEGRDINNTPNPLLTTPAFGRDPVRNFRNLLKDYNNDL